jgi:hypothetical protein
MAWISATPHRYTIDLAIYSDAGQLVANGVNPYDQRANAALRQEIFAEHHRLDSFPPTLERWNQYLAGNLPLSELLFGAVYKVNRSPIALRMVFSVADSLTAVLMFVIVRRYWRDSSKRLAVLIAIAAGLNPLFLLWGTIYPEDKSVQTLLLLAVILLTLGVQRGMIWRWFVAAGMLAAASITFKGFGIFLVPAITAWAWRVGRAAGVVVAGATTAAGTLAVTVPVLGGLATMSITRLDANAFGAPTHASIWIYPYRILPKLQSLDFHVILAGTLTVLIIYLAARRTVSLEVAGGLMCFVFGVVMLVQGSVDRMMIGVMTSIAVLGIHRIDWGIAVSVIWAIASTVAVLAAPRHEAEQGLVILVAILSAVGWLWFHLPARVVAIPSFLKAWRAKTAATHR